MEIIAVLGYVDPCLTLPPVQCSRVARDARVQQSVDRNLFRSSRGVRDSGNVQPRPLGSTFARTAIFRSPRGAYNSQECSTLSIRFNLCENCYKSTAQRVCHHRGAAFAAIEALSRPQTHASPCIHHSPFSGFSVRPASQQCVFAVKSKILLGQFPHKRGDER